MAEQASPYQCARRTTASDGFRYWCIMPDAHGGACMVDLEPGQPDRPPHDFGGMST